MKRASRPLLVTVLCATLSAACSVFGAQDPYAFEMGPVPHNFGVAENTWAPSEDFRRIASLSPRYLRHRTGWADIERERGVYNFRPLDEVYEELALDNIGLLLILAYNNPLYEDAEGGIRTAAGRAAFASFAAATAEHFANRDVMFELWNEPNTATFWREPANSPEIAAEYVALARQAVPAIRAAHPDARIIGGSVSNLWSRSHEWTRAVLQTGILQLGFDAWAIHPYNFDRPEDQRAAYEIVRELLREHGGVRPLPPLVDTERGFPLPRPRADLSDAEIRRFEADQAALLVRHHMVNLMSDVRLTIWYRLRDQEFGLFGDDGPTRSYEAARTMVDQLRGYRYERRLPAQSPEDYLLSFVNAAGERKIVAWTAAISVGRATRTAALPDAVASEWRALDLYGASVAPPGDAVVDGRVEIDGAPRYLVRAR